MVSFEKLNIEDLPKLVTIISQLERIFLVAHKDAFRYTLPNDESGTIKLSQWWIAWSVKWYSDTDNRQIVFLDGVNEQEAKNYFENIKHQLSHSQ